MKEIILYSLLAISSLVVLGYSIHMFIGGLVTPETEFKAITIGCMLGILVIGFLVIDVIKQRRKKN